MRAPCARRPRSEAKVALGTTRVQDTQDAADRRLAHGAARASPAASIQPVSRPCSHLPPPSAVLALVRARKSTTAARTWIAAPPEAAQLRGRPREAPHPRAQHLDDLSSCSPPRTKPLSLPRHDAEDHTRHASSAEQVGAQIPHRRGYGLPQAPLSSRPRQRFEGRPHLDVSSSPREPSKTSAAAWLWSRG